MIGIYLLLHYYCSAQKHLQCLAYHFAVLCADHATRDFSEC